MITIHGQLTEQDYLHAQRLHMQLTGWARLLPPATITVWLIGFIYALTQLWAGNAYFFTILLPLAFVIFATTMTNRLLLPRQAKRLFHQNQEVSAPQEIEISEIGLKLSNSFGHSERTWSQFIKWKEDEQCFLLYHADLIYNALPKRYFAAPAEIDAVRTHLQRHDVPVAHTPRRILGTLSIPFLLVLFTVGMMILSRLLR